MHMVLRLWRHYRYMQHTVVHPQAKKNVDFISKGSQNAFYVESLLTTPQFITSIICPTAMNNAFTVLPGRSDLFIDFQIAKISDNISYST